MIKIPYLIDKLTPAGTQTNLLEVVKRIDRTRFEPKVIALLCGGELVDEFKELGVFPIELGVKRAYGLSGLRALIFLIRFMKKERIDIVQNHFLHADILGTIAAKAAGVKKIITTRRDEGFWRNKRQVFINRFFNHFVDKVLVNSDAVGKAVQNSEKVMPEKIHTIHNGIDIDKFYPSSEMREVTRESLEIREEEVVLGLVANMKHPVKGHRYLIEALSLVVKQGLMVKLLLIGDGSLKGNLEEYAAKLGVRDQILFLGARRDINELINAMDIACLPSLSEGFSNSLLEYMACEKPVIATKVGGNSEVIEEGESGYLLPPQDSVAIAKAILELAKNKELREKMGGKGRERVLAEFSGRRMAEDYEEFYEKLVARFPIRVLYIIWSLDLGGAEQVVIHLVKKLDRSLFEPIVCCLNEKGRYASEVEREGIKVIALHKRPKIDLAIIPKLISLMKREKIDLVHTHLFTSNLWGRFAAILAGVPVISTEHNVDTWKKKIHLLLDNWLVRKNKRIVFVSNKVKEFYEKRLAPLNGKTRVIYNGIDPTRFSLVDGRIDIRKKYGIDSEAHVIGIVGRLVPQKSHVDFLEALKVLKMEGKKVVGLIIGDGPLRKELEGRVKESGLEDSVIFEGFSNDTAPFYPAMDVFVLSSLREGFPLVILEAMASGVPVVATNVSGVGEMIVDGEDGLLVPPGDSLGLAVAIARILQEPVLREKLTAKAKEKVSSYFNAARMVKEHEAIYQEVLAE